MMDETNAYSTTVLQGMEMLLREESLCDVVFEVEGQHFPCHKIVLSAVSAFFKTMFTTPLRNPDEKVIKLDFLNGTNFTLLLDYFYSGKNILNKENACTMLEIANYTQIDILQDTCTRYLIKGLNMENCITVWHLGKKLCLQNLIDETVSYVRKTFDKLIHNESLLEATADDIEKILTSPVSKLPTEDNITEFLLTWLKHNFEQDMEDEKTRVYRFLRLPLCSGEYLISLKLNHKTIFKDEEFVALHERAIEYHLQPARASNLLSMETEQRPASEYENILVIFTRGSEVFAYSFCLERWFRITKPPNLLGINFDVCLSNASTMYVSGGSSSSSTLSKYDGNNNSWTTNTMPFFIHRHAMTTVNNYLYLLGGKTKQDALLNDIEQVERARYAIRRYDPSQDNWCVVGNLSIALLDASSAVMNSKIYLVGGVYPNESGKMVENRSVYVYDIHTDICSEIELRGFHFLRSELFAFPYNSFLFMLDYSGRNGKMYLNQQTFEKGQTIKKEGGIDMAHLFKNKLIVFSKKTSDENDDDDEEEKEKYNVATIEIQDDVADCDKTTLVSPPFKRSVGIARCVSILIKQKHLFVQNV